MAYDIPILIIGGGPIGLTLASELGARQVGCVLLSSNLETSSHPKCNLCNARSMEHFRRLGLSKALRAAGLPDGHSQDVVYVTRMANPELTRFHSPMSGFDMSGFGGDGPETGNGWPTPEPPYRISQIYTERLLKQKADSYDCLDVRFGTELLSLSDRGDHVTARVRDVSTGRESDIKALWAVGCDGGQSTVRKIAGIALEGEGGAKRRFMGGRMLATYFRSPDLTEILSQKSQAHMHWITNKDIRAGTVTINGADEFLTHIQIPDGDDDNAPDPHEFIPRIVGRDIGLEVLSSAIWTAGLCLVAEAFQQGRILLAGDSAHLFTPTGGFGMNTGIDDAANLGWKLAAGVQGWGGDNLISTYSTERRPVALRNTGAARRIANIMGKLEIPMDIEESGPGADAARKKFCADADLLSEEEFNTVGVQLGVRYEGSPITVDDGSPSTEDLPTKYIPSAKPGARAPHFLLNDGRPVFDLFGLAFTLLNFGASSKEASAIEQAAERRGVPLVRHDVSEPEGHALYKCKLVLVRPDGHVAWRGDEAPDDPHALVDVIRGA